ncbi:MAG: hypothetical protein CM15mV19_0650 [uncultured marine virus]|nr:MAG: hypothetical protein CM15mV19_0650 [uncultured marine virus]
MEQGEHEGNIYETHHQPDLTPDIFKERFRYTTSLFENEYYGYYYKLKKSFQELIFFMLIVHTMIHCVQLYNQSD